MKDSPYRKQVELLLRCLPEVGKETCFALKGGTAINLFVRDLPRLSVDIDLADLPRDPWGKVILHVEEGSVTFPKQYLYKPIGQADIPKCPDWLSDSDAFIDIEERSSGNDSGPEKPTAIGVPKERDLENKMLA